MLSHWRTPQQTYRGYGSYQSLISNQSIITFQMVLGGESDLSRGVVGRVWEEMEEAQGQCVAQGRLR